MAPASAQSRRTGSWMDTMSCPAGVIFNVHRPARLFTWLALVTEPPLTVSAWSRMSAALAVMSRLNAIGKLNAVSPSCESGMPSKLAVRGSSPPPLLVLQVGPGPSTLTVAFDGLPTM